jgi:RNA polymerase-binding transcription factor DksA
MADDIDEATRLMEGEIALALKRIRENAAQSTEGSKICLECGEEIPEARQKMGFKYCVICAGAAEKRKSQYAD